MLEKLLFYDFMTKKVRNRRSWQIEAINSYDYPAFIKQ